MNIFLDDIFINYTQKDTIIQNKTVNGKSFNYRTIEISQDDYSEYKLSLYLNNDELINLLDLYYSFDYINNKYFFNTKNLNVYAYEHNKSWDVGENQEIIIRISSDIDWTNIQYISFNDFVNGKQLSFEIIDSEYLRVYIDVVEEDLKNKEKTEWNVSFYEQVIFNLLSIHRLYEDYNQINVTLRSIKTTLPYILEYQSTNDFTYNDYTKGVKYNLVDLDINNDIIIFNRYDINDNGGFDLSYIKAIQYNTNFSFIEDDDLYKYGQFRIYDKVIYCLMDSYKYKYENGQKIEINYQNDISKNYNFITNNKKIVALNPYSSESYDLISKSINIIDNNNNFEYFINLYENDVMILHNYHQFIYQYIYNNKLYNLTFENLDFSYLYIDIFSIDWNRKYGVAFNKNFWYIKINNFINYQKNITLSLQETGGSNGYQYWKYDNFYFLQFTDEINVIDDFDGLYNTNKKFVDVYVNNNDYYFIISVYPGDNLYCKNLIYHYSLVYDSDSELYLMEFIEKIEINNIIGISNNKILYNDFLPLYLKDGYFYYIWGKEEIQKVKFI